MSATVPQLHRNHGSVVVVVHQSSVSLCLSHLVRNILWWSGVVLMSKVGLVSGYSFRVFCWSTALITLVFCCFVSMALVFRFFVAFSSFLDCLKVGATDAKMNGGKIFCLLHCGDLHVIEFVQASW